MFIRNLNKRCCLDPITSGQLAGITLLAFCVSLVINVRGAGTGALDVSYGKRGTTSYEHNQFLNANAIAIQSDGKTVVAGWRRSCVVATCSYDFLIVRYNVDGTLDEGFDEDGTVVRDHSAQDESAYALAIQPDGKILIAGGSIDGTTSLGFKVLRYMPDGSPDMGFGTAGLAYENFDDVGGTASVMVIQPDGKIVVAGCDGVVGGSANSRLFAVRLDGDGNVDPTFGTNGRIATSSFNVSADFALALQSDGKFVFAAMPGTAPFGMLKLIRLTASGIRDDDFGTAGVSTTAINSSFKPVVAIQLDGKILVSGAHDNTDLRYAPLKRFHSDGTVDADFTPDHGPMLNANQCARCTHRVSNVFPLSDGKFYLAGTYRGDPQVQMAVSRYLSTGAIDRSFAYNGTSLPRHTNELTLETLITTTGVDDAALSPDGGSIVLTARYLSYPYRFLTTRIHTTITAPSVRGDFDGDQKTDIAVFRPSSSFWYVLNSGDRSFLSTRFGLAGDVPVPGDYNYDLRTDYSIARPSDNSWWTSPVPATGNGPFGQTGDIRIPEDFDGDGYTDQWSFRSNGLWTIRYSGKPYTYASIPDVTFNWGLGTDVPVPADFDGDGRADLAVFRPSNGVWYIFRSSDDQFYFAPFGLATDKLVPADYDGDLKTDVAVFRDGTWYIQKSSDGSYSGVIWGVAGDIPAPGDYDGDGKYDVAVFRPSEAAWYVLRSSDGGFTSTLFGLEGDMPIASFSVK